MSSFTVRKKKKHPRGDKQREESDRPHKKKSGGRKVKITKERDSQGPLWIRPEKPGPLHPELDLVLGRPFVERICIVDGAISYPLDAGGYARVEGLHRRMRQRFFRGKPLPKINIQKRDTHGNLPKRLGSSKDEGNRADAVLEEAIRTGVPPPGPRKTGSSPYATAAWNYWMDHGHIPVLAQLPVIITNANVGTLGDYFTVWCNPRNGEMELCLWELKTGWPVQIAERQQEIMDPPLAHVPLTAINRWHLQVLITKMAYEREMKMRIPKARVLHVYKERGDPVPGQKDQSLQYTCKAVSYEPSQLTPPSWTENQVLLGVLYDSLRADTRKK